MTTQTHGASLPAVREMGDSNAPIATPHTRRRISIFGPALLILAGLLLLLRNLNSLPGDGWNLVWTYWPVLLIIAGLDDIVRGNFGGAILGMGVGALLLLANLGVIPGWSLWDLLRLWPIFLIIGGIGVVLSGLRSPMASVLGGVLALAVVAGIAVWLRPVTLTGTVINTQRINQPLDGAQRAEVTLATVGTLHVAAMSEPTGLIEGTLATDKGQQVRRDFSVNRGTATLGLYSEGLDVYIGPNTASRWDLKLNPQVPMALNIKLGAGDADLALNHLYVTQLDVDAGVGNTTLTLPDSGRYHARVKGGVGKIRLVIPRGLAARIQARTGLGHMTLPATLLREGDDYITPNYDTAESRVELQVDQAIGEVVVEVR